MCGIDNVYFISFEINTIFYIGMNVDKYIDKSKVNDTEYVSYFIGFQSHFVHNIIDIEDFQHYLEFGHDIFLIILPLSKSEPIHILNMDKMMYNMFSPYFMEEIFDGI
jgi:hypothetical protein